MQPDQTIPLQAISPLDLANALVSKFGRPAVDDEAMHPTDFDWVRFGNSVATALFRSTCCAQVDFMMGSVKPPAVRVKQAPRSQRAKAPTVEAAKPAQLDTTKQDDSNETSKLTEDMFERIRTHGRTPFCFLILNHDSFAQTVENMFSVSMLVTSAKVALRCHNDWGMTVEIASSAKRASMGHVGGTRETNFSQMVVNANFQVWDAMKAKVDRINCLTPNREAIDALTGRALIRKASNEAGPSTSKRARHA